MAWKPLKSPNKPIQVGVVYGYDGATDGVTAHCGVRLGDVPHRKPFGQPCPRCEKPQEGEAA